MSGTIDYPIPLWARIVLAWGLIWRGEVPPLPGSPPAPKPHENDHFDLGTVDRRNLT